MWKQPNTQTARITTQEITHNTAPLRNTHAHSAHTTHKWRELHAPLDANTAGSHDSLSDSSVAETDQVEPGIKRDTAPDDTRSS